MKMNLTLTNQRPRCFKTVQIKYLTHRYGRKVHLFLSHQINLQVSTMITGFHIQLQL